MLRVPDSADTPTPLTWQRHGEIARGSSATVYRVAQTGPSRQGALKVLHDPADELALARFARERDVVSALEHPRIPRLLDAGTDEHGRPWIVLEHIDGTPLADCLGRPERAATAAAVIEQIGDALAYAHARGVVHRDVCPRNILLSERGAYLVDFGLAALEADATLTAPDAALGTLAFAAPEQLLGGQASGASDVYGLAACAFAMLTGAPPHPGETTSAVLRARQSGDRREIRARCAQAQEAVRLVESALAADPGARPANIGRWSQQLAEAIEVAGAPHDAFEVARSQETAHLTAAFPAPPRRRAHRRRTATGVAIVAGAISAIGLAASRPDGSAAPPQAAPAAAPDVIRSGEFRLSLPNDWVALGGADDQVSRAAHPPSGATLRLASGRALAGVPGWATRRAVPVRADGVRAVRWDRGDRTRVLVLSSAGAAIVDCWRLGPAGADCSALAAAAVPQSGATPAMAAGLRATALLRPALRPWRVAPRAPVDVRAARARAAERSRAAQGLKAQLGAWTAVREVHRTIAALSASSVAIDRHAARGTAASWAALQRTEARLRAALAALGLILDVPQAGRLSVIQRPAPPGAQRGAPSSASTPPQPAPSRSTSTDTPSGNAGERRSPDRSAPSDEVGEEPVVVGPAL